MIPLLDVEADYMLTIAEQLEAAGNLNEPWAGVKGRSSSRVFLASPVLVSGLIELDVAIPAGWPRANELV